MPRYRNPGSVKFEEFIEALAVELKGKPQPPPGDPFAVAGDKPVIFETPTGLGERFTVTVVWDRWGGLPVEDRNRIIMEAYRRVIGSESVNIGLALGVTRVQFDKMTTSGAQIFGV